MDKPELLMIVNDVRIISYRPVNKKIFELQIQVYCNTDCRKLTTKVFSDSIKMMQNNDKNLRTSFSHFYIKMRISFSYFYTHVVRAGP